MTEAALRLLADDLTGALDSVAPFASTGPIPVFWDAPDGAVTGSCALDSETRDLDARAAKARVTALAPLLAGAAVAFKKLDSRLRGHVALEIAACAEAGGFATVVVAPAFPAQGRITRDGRQHVRDEAGGWQALAPDLAAALAAVGLPAVLTRRPTGPGVFVCDAESAAELAAIAACRRELRGPVLWCGTGGLAQALAGPARSLRPRIALEPPVLVVAGTGHPATGHQLARLHARPGLAVRALDHTTLPSPAHAQAALVTLTRAVAAEPPPGTLIATGGETLLRLCQALGARRLDALGELAPGIPVSRLVGGAWDGVPVVSKSGGFGAPDLLATLIREIAHG